MLVAVHSPCPDGLAAAAAIKLSGLPVAEYAFVRHGTNHAQVLAWMASRTAGEPSTIAYFDILPSAEVIAALDTAPDGAFSLVVGDHHVSAKACFEALRAKPYTRYAEYGEGAQCGLRLALAWLAFCGALPKGIHPRAVHDLAEADTTSKKSDFVLAIEGRDIDGMCLALVVTDDMYASLAAIGAAAREQRAADIAAIPVARRRLYDGTEVAVARAPVATWVNDLAARVWEDVGFAGVDFLLVLIMNDEASTAVSTWSIRRRSDAVPNTCVQYASRIVAWLNGVCQLLPGEPPCSGGGHINAAGLQIPHRLVVHLLVE